MKSIVLYGLYINTLRDAQGDIEEVSRRSDLPSRPALGDCAKDAALLLAGKRELLSALPVRHALYFIVYDLLLSP